MKRQLLFVHGGGEGAYEEDRKMAASLRDALGGYEVQCPKMPDEDSPQYAAWRDRIASELAELDGEVSLVGHSLGASILLKYKQYAGSCSFRRHSSAMDGTPRSSRGWNKWAQRPPSP